MLGAAAATVATTVCPITGRNEQQTVLPNPSSLLLMLLLSPPPSPAPLQVGGMGFIHYNCTIAEQAAAVAKVKAHIPGFVVTPVCMKPSDTVSALDNLKVGQLIRRLRERGAGILGGVGKRGEEGGDTCLVLWYTFPPYSLIAARPNKSGYRIASALLWWQHMSPQAQCTQPKFTRQYP
jgi:hypothetical protein